MEADRVTEHEPINSNGGPTLIQEWKTPSRRWIILFIVLALLFFALWLLIQYTNSKPSSFVGLQPLHPPHQSNNSYDDLELSEITEYESYEESSTCDQEENDKDKNKEIEDDKDKNKEIEDDKDKNKEIEDTSTKKLSDSKLDGLSTTSNQELNEPAEPIYTFNIEAALARKRRNESKGEAICRAAFEQIYQQPFPSVRPDFLKNPETGANLELDGYNGALRIAFEYNGQQHYVFPNRWHATREAFDNQIRRDMFKQEMCRRAGITLISIPYTVPHAQLYEYISSRVRNLQTRERHT
jgi:hypothetical protein